MGYEKHGFGMSSPGDVPKPDGWSGWVWDPFGNQWIEGNDASGHQAWLAQQQQVADLQAQVDDVKAEAPTMETVEAQGGGAAELTRDPQIDQAQLNDQRIKRDAALADQRETLKFALGLQGPQQLTPEERMAMEQRFAERATLAANTTAANARGGAGAVGAARMAVNQNMPAIAGEANIAATQAAGQEYQQRVQAFQSRVAQAQVAGGIASGIGQTSTAAFGQEAQVAANGAQIDLGVLGIEVQNQGLVNNMIQHIDEMGINYAQLDVGTQIKILDDMTQRYGIDKTTAAQLKIAAQQNKKGPLEYLGMIAKGGTDSVAAAKGLGVA